MFTYDITEYGVLTAKMEFNIGKTGMYGSTILFLKDGRRIPLVEMQQMECKKGDSITVTYRLILEDYDVEE